MPKEVWITTSFQPPCAWLLSSHTSGQARKTPTGISHALRIPHPPSSDESPSNPDTYPWRAQNWSLVTSWSSDCWYSPLFCASHYYFSGERACNTNMKQREMASTGWWKKRGMSTFSDEDRKAHTPTYLETIFFVHQRWYTSGQFLFCYGY